ncbi:MAG: pyrroline-5-carboxylate reductase [Lachnospiraceae bacterium]|nr:pyrroline-5-carboxylate reductase [Lachnospiraceae bacterium]
MKKIGFFGAGNMGFPILKAAVKLLGADQVGFFEKNDDRSKYVTDLTAATRYKTEKDLAANCEYILFAVKPQIAPAVFESIKGFTDRNTRFISIMAGVTTDTIRKGLGIDADVPICRLMPNTPAMVNEGMTCMCLSGCTEDSTEAKFTKTLCSAFGRVAVLPEKLMSAATCANGSSPAYVYMFIEALADGVVKYGIPRDTAYILAAQTVLGSAKMVLESGEHPGKLKDNVCSPGGTTIAALSALEEYGFRNAIMKATDACYDKSVELSKNK